MDRNKRLTDMTWGEVLDGLGLSEVQADVAEVGEPYDGQKIVDLFTGSDRLIDPNGKWWKRALAKVPTRILYDDIDKAETDLEMEILEVNEEFLGDTYGRKTRYGFSLGSVVVLPALDIDGSRLHGLACVPNVNVLDGVRSEYAHAKVDEVVKNLLHAGWEKDNVKEGH